MHAPRPRRGSLHPPHLKVIKLSEPAHQDEVAPRPPLAERLVKTAALSTNLRTIFLDLLLLIGICLAGAMVYKLVFARETLIETITVPDELSKTGYSGNVFQSLVANHLIGLEERAADVIPASAKEEVKLDTDMPDFSVPGTSVSAKAMLQYVRETLPLPMSTITGSVTAVPGTKGRYVLHLTLVERGGVYHFDTPESPIAELDRHLDALAQTVLQKHNPYIYASYASAVAQARCYAGNGTCDFSEAQRIFSSIVNAGEDQPNYKWAVLALSKIDEAYHDYKGEIDRVSDLASKYPSSWSFYNWGVALSELGCQEMAIGAFEQAIAWHASREAPFNAVGRTYLMLAKRERDMRSVKAINELKDARDNFLAAIRLKPDYQEARVNLAESLQLLDKPDDARFEYSRAIEMDPAHAGLAYARYAEMFSDPQTRATLRGLANWADMLHDECRPTNSASLLEALGCSVATQIQSTAMVQTGAQEVRLVRATPRETDTCRGYAIEDRLLMNAGLPERVMLPL